MPKQSLGSAQRVFDGLAHHPGEGEAEKLIGAHIQETHRLALHRVNKAYAIREFGAAGNQRRIKLGQFFGGYSEIGIEDHQDVSSSYRECLSNRVSLSDAGLLNCLQIEVGVFPQTILNPLPRVILGMAFDKNDFS